MLLFHDGSSGSLTNFFKCPLYTFIRKLPETAAGWREVKAFASTYEFGGGGREMENSSGKLGGLFRWKDFREIPNTMVISLHR